MKKLEKFFIDFTTFHVFSSSIKTRLNMSESFRFRPIFFRIVLCKRCQEIISKRFIFWTKVLYLETSSIDAINTFNILLQAWLLILSRSTRSSCITLFSMNEIPYETKYIHTIKVWLNNSTIDVEVNVWNKKHQLLCVTLTYFNIIYFSKFFAENEPISWKSRRNLLKLV